MNCYIITYDLLAPRVYEPLYTAIKSYGTWAKITESTWAIVTDQTAAQVRDYLMKYVDVNDRIFVIRSGTEAAWNNVKCGPDWLKKNL